jgi:hypothetical protein
LNGLEQVARIENRAGEVQTRAGQSPWNWESFLTQSELRSALPVIGEVGPHTVEGLERTLHRLTYDFQGGFGELLAARSVIRDFGGRQLRLGRLTDRAVGARTVWREIDIEAQVGGRSVHFEVKTNLSGQASRSWGQIRKDMAAHARTRYQNLVYLYHPSVAGDLPNLAQEMLALFGTATSPVDAELLRGLRAEGVSVAQARADFQRWLSSGGLTTYQL